MKKLIFVLLGVMLAFNIQTTVAANNSSGAAALTLAAKKAEHSKLVNRVYEIRDMNKTALTATEKTRLTNEPKIMKERLGDPDFTGLYLSSGVIIIILIVLLILALR